MLLDLTLELNGKDLIDFLDEKAHLWDKLNETFWNKDHTIVLASVSSLANYLNNLLGDVVKSLILLRDFLTNQAAVSPRLQSAFKSNMRGRSAHKSDEMVVLA